MISPAPLPAGEHADIPAADINECYRCGYDLRTIDNAHPCPECGLLAERSRHLTDELHDTRPRWLRSLARGVWLMLNWLIADIGPIVFLIGVICLTVEEGYPPADQADASLRWLLRRAAGIPLVTLLASQLDTLLEMWFPPVLRSASGFVSTPAFWALGIIAALAIPPLLFERLRTLAKRARSAHLAEHCRIVGVGSTLSIIAIGIISIVLYYGDQWFGDNWSSGSNTSLLLMLTLLTSALLFLLWSLYLLIRFAIAFHFAARNLRRQWKSADRSAA